jgi:hypothetical protein
MSVITASTDMAVKSASNNVFGYNANTDVSAKTATKDVLQRITSIDV